YQPGPGSERPSTELPSREPRRATEDVTDMAFPRVTDESGVAARQGRPAAEIPAARAADAPQQPNARPQAPPRPTQEQPPTQPAQQPPAEVRVEHAPPPEAPVRGEVPFSPDEE